MSEGPSANDIALQAQRMQGAAKDTTAPPENLSDFFNSLFDKFVSFIGSKVLGVNSETMLKTGAFANLNFQQGGIQVNNQIMKQALIPDAQGGALAQIALSVFSKPDFGSISAGPIDALVMNSGVEISPSELGTFSPPTFDGMAMVGRGGGMELS